MFADFLADRYNASAISENQLAELRDHLLEADRLAETVMGQMGGGTTDLGGGLAQSVEEYVEWVRVLAGGVSNIGRGLHAQGKIADATEFAERALESNFLPEGFGYLSDSLPSHLCQGELFQRVHILCTLRGKTVRQQAGGATHPPAEVTPQARARADSAWHRSAAARRRSRR